MRTNGRATPRSGKAPECVIPGCGKPERSKKHGLCDGHLTRYYRSGDVGGARLRVRRRHAPFAGTSRSRALARLA